MVQRRHRLPHPIDRVLGVQFMGPSLSARVIMVAGLRGNHSALYRMGDANLAVTTKS